MTTWGNIYLGNDHTISLNGLSDSLGSPIASATVNATLLVGSTLQPAAGQSWPLSMASIAPGDYEAVMDKAVSIHKGVEYLLRITAAAGDSDAQWDLPVTCEYRQD